MNIIEYLRYHIESWRNPTRKDFINGGYGISERYKRCERYWAPHLKLSKEFIAAALGGLERSEILILGAGRLLDVPLLQASSHARRITLVDADPAAVSSWKAAQRKVPPTTELCQILADVSGRLDRWTAALSAQPRDISLQAAEKTLRSLLAPSEPPLLPASPSECVVSVNLLSQIPIFWEDRVRAAWPHLAQGPEDLFAPPLEQALTETKSRLIDEHLSMLERLSTSRIVLLSDLLFHYYTKDQSDWRTEPALGFERDITIHGFNLVKKDSWLWHLAPQGIERTEYGEIHTVGAFDLRRTQEERGDR